MNDPNDDPESGGEYRTPGTRRRDVLAEQISKFSLCYALSEHRRALEVKGRGRSFSGLEVTAIKAGIFNGTIKDGDQVEGEALASPFAVVYQPRAYYPAYVMGEIRAALRRGQNPPSTSPHYLTVSRLPALPDGWKISFLYPSRKKAFDRPDFPDHVRDVLTRDYQRLPLLLPPAQEEWQGRVRFRARLLRLSRDSLERLAGMGENSYDAFAARGLIHFLEPLEVEGVGEETSLRGSLFAEASLPEEVGWERISDRLEEMVSTVVEEVFPECGRGEREEGGCYLPQSGHHLFRFRSRLVALVFHPVIVVYRAPCLLGIYLPGDLDRREDHLYEQFQELVRRLLVVAERKLELPSPARVEVTYDNRAAWARERKALRGPSFERLEKERPFLRPTLSWLRGG